MLSKTAINAQITGLLALGEDTVLSVGIEKKVIIRRLNIMFFWKSN